MNAGSTGGRLPVRSSVPPWMIAAGGLACALPLSARSLDLLSLVPVLAEPPAASVPYLRLDGSQDLRYAYRLAPVDRTTLLPAPAVTVYRAPPPPTPPPPAAPTAAPEAAPAPAEPAPEPAAVAPAPDPELSDVDKLLLIFEQKIAGGEVDVPFVLPTDVDAQPPLKPTERVRSRYEIMR